LQNEDFNCHPRKFIKYLLTKGGSFDVIKWAFEKEIRPLEMVLLLLNNETFPESFYMNFAAGAGNLDAIKFFYKKKILWTHSATENAAEKGHLHILKYAFSNFVCNDEKSVTYSLCGCKIRKY
jgi:hypothetical protein